MFWLFFIGGSLLLTGVFVVWIRPETTAVWATVLLLASLVTVLASRLNDSHFLVVYGLELFLLGGLLWFWAGIWLFKLLPTNLMHNYRQFQQQLWTKVSRW